MTPRLTGHAKVSHEVSDVSTLHNIRYPSLASRAWTDAPNPLPVIGENGRSSFVETLKRGGQLRPNGVAPTRRVHTDPGDWTLARIYERVVRGEQGCHLWTGPKNQFGYGQVSVTTGGRQVCWKIHRLTYTLAVGPIPVGLTLDHTCQHRHCVNPLHLEPVTLRENQQRRHRREAAA